jgi:hypothetical protein
MEVTILRCCFVDSDDEIEGDGDEVPTAEQDHGQRPS